MKIVLIDIDSTLNNFQEHFLRVFRERHPSVAAAAEKAALLKQLQRPGLYTE